MLLIFEVAGVFILHLMLKLNWVMTLILLGYFMIMGRVHKSLSVKKDTQIKRFRDACVYMDTVLYTFSREGKIFQTFEAVEDSLKTGELKDCVRDALEHMKLTFDESEVISDAMRRVYDKYACSRIDSIHSFMLHVEYYGGEIKDAVNLLIDDKNRWARRIEDAIGEKSKMFRDVVMSVAVSLMICGIILYLPVMKVDISKNWIVQIFSVVVIIVDDLIILKGQKLLAADYLMLDALNEDAEYEKKIKDYKNWNEKKEKKNSIIFALFPGAGMLACYLMDKSWLMAICMLIFLVCINQHKIGRALAGKSLSGYIQSAFPKWLMDMALLLQSENVYMSLVKSREHVPGVLRDEVACLIGKIEIDPESSVPYHDFLKDFNLPEVHSTVAMLYSISNGNSISTGKQINELISRNLEMLDRADTLRLHNKNSGMYLLFLAPVLTASIKMVTDMAVFLLSFLTVSMT